MSRSLTTFLLPVLLAWFVAAAASANTPVLLPQESFSYSITPYAAIFEDSSRRLTISEMVQRDYQLRFSPSHAQALKFGLSNSNYWLRFSINNPYQQPREVIITLSDSDFDLLEVFEITSPATYVHITPEHPARNLSGGFMQAHPILLTLPPRSTSTYMIQVHSEGLFSAHLRMLSRDRFLANEQFYSLLAGISFSWIMATLAFFLFIWTTRKLMFSMAAAVYCLAILVYQPAWSGHLNLLLGMPPAFADKLGELALAVSASAHLLACALLPWQGRHARLIKRSLQLAAAGQLSLSVLIILLLPQPAMLLIVVQLMLSAVIMMPLLLLLPSQNLAANRWLSIGFILLLGGALLTLLTSYNLLSFDSMIIWAPLLMPLVVIASLVAAAMLLSSPHQQPAQPRQTELRLTPALLAHISHELRSPINGVLGMHELLADTPLTQQQKELTDTIALASQDLLHIADAISDTARLHNGLLELERQSFDPAKLITGLISHFRLEAARKQVELVLDLSDNLPALVGGDPARLRLALHNLLARALAYSEQGEMAVSVSAFSSPQTSGIRLQIQLSNTVLKQEELKSAFQILQYQLPVPDSRNDKNWSLLLTRFLFQRMQAQLEVESMTTRGASLALYMPLPAQQPAITPAPATDTLQGRRVLIVDDSASLRAVVERQTKRWGMRPDSTYSGKEALAMLRNQITLGAPYDLIIMDHDMPVMNGLQLAEKIQQDDNISIKPARLMLTGINLSLIRQDAAAAGIQCLLAKPAHSERLRQALIDLLQTGNSATEH